METAILIIAIINTIMLLAIAGTVAKIAECLIVKDEPIEHKTASSVQPPNWDGLGGETRSDGLTNGEREWLSE